MSLFRQRKLKVFSAGPAATVSVFQDGDAVDADATSGYQFDDAFFHGAQRPDTTGRVDREWIDLRTLESTYDDGKTLVFALNGRYAFADTEGVTVRLNPNDKVEFWAEAPTALSAATPAWHLNDATPGDQVRLFVGWVEEIEATPGGGVVATCRDAIRKADDLILARPGVSAAVPRLAINPDANDPDFYWGLKITTGSTYSYGEGVSANNRGTLAQILTWLWTEYEAELVGLGVVDSGTDLFHADDLALLTQKPGPIVFERTGFGTAVRELMKWAPDKRIVVDHQTGQWRFIQWGAALKSDQAVVFQHFHTGSGGYQDEIRIPSPGQTYFSATPGADGNRVRIYDLTDPTQNEEFTIHSIVYVGVVGGDYALRTNETLKKQTYQLGSKLYPVRNTALPTLSLPIDDALSVELRRDLQGAYSAVNLYSIHQKTEVVNEALNGLARLKPAWDQGFDPYWKDKDAQREADWGTDAEGLVVHRIGTVSGRDALYVRYEDSAYGDDHAPNEWQGCTLWVWTKDGGTDCKASKHVFEVYSQGHVADVGDGKPGMSILLVGSAGDFAAAVGDFDFDGGTDIGTPAGADLDRVVLTSDQQFTTTAARNRRSVVGKLWYIDHSDQLAGATSGPHQGTCAPPKIQYDNGYGGVARVSTLDPGSAYPAANWKPKGDFEYIGGGGVGTSLIWRRKSVVTQKPIAQACGGPPGWQAPNNLLATSERTLVTARSARFPASGHAGHAYAAYNLSRVLHVPVDPWTSDDQNADFEALAERLWDAHQNAHARGTIRLAGQREWSAMLDLGVRVTPTTERGEFSRTAGVEGFWGPLSSVRIDLRADADAVEFGFDSEEALKKLLDDTYFTLFERYATPGFFRGWVRRVAEVASCVAGSTVDPPITSTCAGSIYTPGGRPLPPIINKPNKDNAENDISETAIGLAEGDGAAASGGGGKFATHGGTASATVFLGNDGSAFAIGGRGEFIPGTVSGNEFTPSGAASYGPRGKLDRLEDEAEGQAAMFGGMQLGHEQYRPIYARTDAASTTSKIEVKAPTLPVVADATGWTLHVLDYLDRLPREVYDVASIEADAITLDAAIADAAGAPAEDVLLILVPPRKPLPDPTDFTVDGSYGFQDDAGDWFVFEPDGSTGTVYRATLVGNLLEKVASGSGTLSLKVGPTAGNANVSVEVDFTGATVVGISGGGGGASGEYDDGLITESTTLTTDYGTVP